MAYPPHTQDDDTLPKFSISDIEVVYQHNNQLKAKLEQERQKANEERKELEDIK
jgi:hypothetical protein